jgi:hypothetical protein
MATREDLSKKFFEILAEFGKEFSEDLIQELIDKKVVGGGGSASELAGSIKFRVTRVPSIEFTMNDYWEFVEYGRRKGKKPPIDAIVQWIKWKGIRPTLYDKLKDKTLGKTKGAERKQLREAAYEKSVKSLAFAIANKIAEKGTIKRFNYKGANFITDVLNDRVERLEKRLLDEVGIEIQVELTDRLKNGNK